MEQHDVRVARQFIEQPPIDVIAIPPAIDATRLRRRELAVK
jgi:hypothetical protein